MDEPNRKMVSFRLTEECRNLLSLIGRAKGISQSAVLELLVRDEADRLRLETELKLAA